MPISSAETSDLIGGSSRSHPRRTAMSVYRVGVCRYTEPRESGYRIGVCRYTDPDPVGIPTPSESVARHSKAGIPTLPRGSGDCPQKVAKPIYRHRQADRTSRNQSIDRPPYTRYNDSTPPDISTQPKSLERPAPCRYIDIRHRQVVNSSVDD